MPGTGVSEGSFGSEVVIPGGNSSSWQNRNTPAAEKKATGHQPIRGNEREPENLVTVSRGDREPRQS